MSYILDALRRADAERERDKGAVPGLHARPLATPAEEPAAAAQRPGLLLAALGVSLGLLLALVGWIFLREGAPAAPGAAVVSAAPPAAAPGQMPPAATQPAAAGAGMAPSPPVPRPAEPTLAAPPPATIVQVVPVPVPAPAPAPTAAPAPRPQPAAEASPAAAPVPAGPSPAAAPSPAATRPVPLAQLPPDLRAQWPALVVGGSVYSDNAASRFVIFNGQIVREGDSPAPGLLVERIGPKSAVLRWRELRVEVPL
jgi:general secretion pathway protein B